MATRYRLARYDTGPNGSNEIRRYSKAQGQCRQSSPSAWWALVAIRHTSSTILMREACRKNHADTNHRDGKYLRVSSLSARLVATGEHVAVTGCNLTVKA